MTQSATAQDATVPGTVRRRTLNGLVIALVGIGMPAYYKVKYYLLGQITLGEIFDPLGLIDVAFAASLTALILGAHDRVVPWVRSHLLRGRGPWGRFFLQLTTTTAVSLALVLVYSRFFFGVLYPSALPADFLFDLLLLGGVVPLFVHGLEQSVYYYGELERAAQRRAELERENAEAQYRILQSQVDPHFLFNCLNTLDELLETSKEQARQFVARLAGVYRFLLENLDHDVVPLEDELRFLDSYLYLVRSRFGDTLRVDVRIDDADRRRGLVPMTLQMLFENALKHNVASRDQPLGVEISTTDGTDLVFRSDLRPKRSAGSLGVGLRNLRDRYRFVSGSTLEVEQSDLRFTVRLPLVEVAT